MNSYVVFVLPRQQTFLAAIVARALPVLPRVCAVLV